MSGFLHRIAARVIGNESRAHTHSLSPYATSPFQESTLESESPTLPSALHEKPVAINNSREPVSASFQQERNLLYPMRENELSTSVPEIVVQAHMESGAVSQTQGALLIAQREQQHSITDGISPIRPHATEVLQSQAVSDSSDVTHIDQSISLVDNNDNNLPPAMLPQTANLHAKMMSPDAKMPHRTKLDSNTSPAKAEEPLEVHVHIGRIEVTAVHEAPAQQRRPTSIRKPMSLDEYLDRRGKS